MAERLGEVAEQFAAARIHLLGQQPDVVDVGRGPVENGTGPRNQPRAGECLGEPEGAQQEGSLLAGKSVVGSVAVDQAVIVGELTLRRLDGGEHPRVVGRQEADAGDQQAGRVQAVTAEYLGERSDLSVPTVREYRRADLLAGSPPLRRLAVRAEQRRHLDGTVQRHPAHQLGVQIVTRLAAHLPDALIGLLPARGGGVGEADQEPTVQVVEFAEDVT